jgi:hypothetical protein
VLSPVLTSYVLETTDGGTAVGANGLRLSMSAMMNSLLEGYVSIVGAT